MKRWRSDFTRSPKSPNVGRVKKAPRMGTLGTRSLSMRVVGSSTRLTCSMGYLPIWGGRNLYLNRLMELPFVDGNLFER
jgi:hypothetical protein